MPKKPAFVTFPEKENRTTFGGSDLIVPTLGTSPRLTSVTTEKTLGVLTGLWAMLESSAKVSPSSSRECEMSRDPWTQGHTGKRNLLQYLYKLIKGNR